LFVKFSEILHGLVKGIAFANTTNLLYNLFVRISYRIRGGSLVKKYISLLLVLMLALSFGLTGCAGSDEPTATTETDVTKVVLLINGNLGDRSFFDSAEVGFNRLVEDYAGKVEVKIIEMGFDNSKWEPGLIDASEAGYDVIVVGTWQMQELLEDIAPQYPDNNYIIFDTVANPEIPNIYSMLYKQNECAYLAGAVAASVAGDEPIGFLGGMDILVINDFLVGYIEGAQSVKSDVQVKISYIGDFNDSAKGKEMALAQYQSGVAIGFNVAGQAGLGQIDAAAEVNKLAIGVDSDQEALFRDMGEDAKADLIATSALKEVGNSLYRAIEMHMDGTLPYGESEALGLAEGAVGYVKSQWVIDNGYGDMLDELEAKIAAGDVVVSSANGLTTEELTALRDAVK
jgi:basic membrane protein A